MKKAIVLALALILACAAGASAFEIGIGAEYMFYTTGLSHNALLTAACLADAVPARGGATFGSAPSFSITGDWCSSGRISGSALGYYVALAGS